MLEKINPEPGTLKQLRKWNHNIWMMVLMATLGGSSAKAIDQQTMGGFEPSISNNSGKKIGAHDPADRDVQLDPSHLYPNWPAEVAQDIRENDQRVFIELFVRILKKNHFFNLQEPGAQPPFFLELVAEGFFTYIDTNHMNSPEVEAYIFKRGNIERAFAWAKEQPKVVDSPAAQEILKNLQTQFESYVLRSQARKEPTIQAMEG